MAPVLNFQVLTLKINGNTGKTGYGWSESHSLKPQSSDTAYINVASYIAETRALSLGINSQIVAAVVSDYVNVRKTLHGILNPIDGKYTAAAAPGVGTINVTGADPAVAMVQNAAEWNVDDPEECAQFFFEAEERMNSTRSFHGIPDFWTDNFTGFHITDADSWYDDPPIIDLGTIPDLDVNYWKNFKAHFNALIDLTARVENIYLPGTQTLDPAGPYVLRDYTRIGFSCIGDRQVGRPFNLLRARS